VRVFRPNRIRIAPVHSGSYRSISIRLLAKLLATSELEFIGRGGKTMSLKRRWEPLADQMAIAHAPRLEIVLSPEGKTGPEGAEIGESALFNPYLIMHNPDGSATNLQLDSGPFNYE
jgi:hypothetical protein